MEQHVAELKTKANSADVMAFLARVEDDARRKDCLTVLKMMKRATRAAPRMWGSSIVGFGRFHYKYASGREGDWFLTGFSPRKQSLTLYLMNDLRQLAPALERLGRHTIGRGCLYIKRLDDVKLPVLQELIERSVKAVRQTD